MESNVADEMNLLSLTACVRPSSVQTLTVRDVDERREQYERALRSWTRTLDPELWKVALVENSDADLSTLEDIARSARLSVEVVQLPSIAAQPSEGKGPGEARILQAATNLPGFDIVENVVKCTGRLFVSNHVQVLAGLRGGLRCGIRSSLNCVDSRFFAGPPAFWRGQPRAVETQIDESRGICSEHSLNKAALGFLAAGGEWSRYPRPPRFEGVSGSTGIDYRRSHPSRRAHDLARAMVERRRAVL